MYRTHPNLARRIIAGALVGGLLLAACSDDEATTTTSAAPGTTTGTETTADGRDPGLVLGYVRPGAGLLSQLATAQEAAINLAIDDLNAAGGVNGGPVELLAVDESLDGDTAAAVNDLLDQGANMILGPIGSSGAKAALDPLATRKSVACSASATSPELSTLDEANVLYRTAMPDSFTLNYVADALTADAEAAALPEGTAYKVSILARNDDYGINVGNGLASTLTARGMDVQVVQYSPRQVIFTSEATAIAATTPDAVVLVAYGEGVRQVDTLVTAGVAASKIVGLDGLFDPNFAQRASNTDPSRVDGMRVIGSTGDRAFLDRMAAVPGLDQLIFGAQAYDCTIIGALAAATAKSSDPVAFAQFISAVTDSGRSCSTVADCLEKLAAGEDIDYEGVSGGIRFDEVGDPAEVRLTTGSFTAGELAEVSSTDLDLDDLRQQEALASAIMISRLQQVLAVLGYYSGPIDGQWSDEVTASVAALQSDLGVPVTGVWDEATDAAARAKYGDVMSAFTDSVASIQQLLTDLGFYTGPIDGVYSQETVEAIRALQRELGVPETGILDAATLQAAFEKGIVVGTPSTTVPPASTVPNTTIPTPTTSIPVVPPDPSAPSILDSLKADDRFTTLVELLTAAGFTDDANVLGPITLFAPTNDAFAAVDPAVLEALQNDPVALQRALSFHLVDAGITLSFLGTLSSVPTMYGEALTVTVDGEVVLVNGVATIAPELRASNGIIIPIAGVLIPTVQPKA
jgi:branched-chain amino acid transport system substrate-binding protein